MAEECTEHRPKIGRNLCRVEVFIYWPGHGGYRKDILTENLTETEIADFICTICEGIMKEACVSESGEQFCLYCKKGSLKETPNEPVREMISSLKCSCPLIESGCQWLGTLDNCENHLDTCGYVREKCKLKCGVVLRRDELRIHEKECPQRVVKCDHCEEDFKSCEQNKHLDKCPKTKVSCKKCDIEIRREDMIIHLYYYCGMVQETCELGCGAKPTRNELRIHETDSCEQRKIQCEDCHDMVKLCDMPKHLKQCTGVVSCGLCGVEKCRKDMTEHVKDYCPENETDCPFVKYKCLARIKRKDIDKHLEEKETKHLGLKLTAMEDLITKQREEIDQQTEIIHRQNEGIDELTKNIEKYNRAVDNQNIKINKQSEEKTKTSSSQQMELLYSITDTAEIVWKIEKVTDLAQDYQSLEYETAGYKYFFMLRPNGEICIVFPETTPKHVRPFIAKCHIVFHPSHATYCGTIEVKQKDLTKGCERIISSISKGNIERYSKPRTGDTKKDLTLKLYLTMQ